MNFFMSALVLIGASLLSSCSGFSATLVAEKTKLTTTWEPDAELKIRKLLDDRRSRPNDGHAESSSPFMVALCGIPGSGKSTSAGILGDSLNDAGYPSLVFPHDGYHYSIDELKTFPEPEAAIYRRGAPDTFDSSSLLTDLQRIRRGEENTIFLPGFDHAVGDPEEDAHAFHRSQHRVVICEGLYLLHDEDGWNEIADCFDLSIFIDADLDLCMERLKIRNACIPGYTPEEIAFRVDAVDRQNAMTVARAKDRANIVHKSCAC